MAAFLRRTTIAKAFGLDDATLLEASRCYPDESQIEPGPKQACIAFLTVYEHVLRLPLLPGTLMPSNSGKKTGGAAVDARAGDDRMAPTQPKGSL